MAQASSAATFNVDIVLASNDLEILQEAAKKMAGVIWFQPFGAM